MTLDWIQPKILWSSWTRSSETNGVNASHSSLIPNTNTVECLETKKMAATSDEGGIKYWLPSQPQGVQ